MPSVMEALLRTGRDREEQLRIEDSFFKGLRLYNGTYKTTRAGRMAEVDRYCASLAPRGEKLQLLDIGVSSGITSVDLLDALTSCSAQVELTAVDLVMHGRLLRFGAFAVLMDSHNRTLQVCLGAVGRGRPHSPQTSVKRLLLDAFMRASGQLARIAAPSRRNIAIVSQSLANRPNVKLCEQNLFAGVAAWRRNFWLVRAANVLNLEYFEPQVLRRGIRHLLGYVKVNGYLLINRSVDGSGENKGSLFQHRPDGTFVLTHEFGGGSEVAALVSECAADMRKSG